MSNDLLIAIVTASASIVVAIIGAGTVLFRQGKALEIKVDGRLTQLLASITAEGVTASALAGSEGRAEGKATEQQDQRDRERSE